MEIRGKFERERVAMDEWEESRTVRGEADTTDINTIVERFQRTGMMPPGKDNGQYGDVSNLQGKDLTELIAEKQRIDAEMAKFTAEMNKAPAEVAEKPERQPVTPEPKETEEKE